MKIDEALCTTWWRAECCGCLDRCTGCPKILVTKLINHGVKILNLRNQVSDEQP